MGTWEDPATAVGIYAGLRPDERPEQPVLGVVYERFYQATEVVEHILPNGRTAVYLETTSPLKSILPILNWAYGAEATMEK